MARKIFKADEAEAKYIENSSAGKFKQDDALFIAQELNYIRARALEVEHSPLNSFRVFPQETDVPAGAETALTIVYDSVGMAKIVADYGDDLPVLKRLQPPSRPKSTLLRTATDTTMLNWNTPVWLM